MIGKEVMGKEVMGRDMIWKNVKRRKCVKEEDVKGKREEDCMKINEVKMLEMEEAGEAALLFLGLATSSCKSLKFKISLCLETLKGGKAKEVEKKEESCLANAEFIPPLQVAKAEGHPEGD